MGGVTDEFRFGAVVGMDYEPEMRLLVLCRASERKRAASLHPDTWEALVLAAPSSWEMDPGLTILTVSPANAGVRVLGTVGREGEGGP